MSQWILRVDGRVHLRQTVRPLTNEELWSLLEIARRKAFDATIKRKLGDAMTILERRETEEYLPYEDEEISEEMLDTDEDQYDLLVNAGVNLPHMNKQMKAVVVSCYCNGDGNLVGTKDDNPIMSTASSILCSIPRWGRQTICCKYYS